AGDLTVNSDGNLSFAQASASGAIGLTSVTGSVTATGPVTAGGTVNLGGAAGFNFASLSSGGTTTLNAPGGAILVTTDLQSAGNVTATGRSIDINSFADLSFAHAQASAGDLHVASTGNLTFAQASATGAIGLSGDIVTATGPVTAGGA